MRRYGMVCPVCGGWIETNETDDTGSCDTCDVTIEAGELIIPDEEKAEGNET